MPDAWDPCQFRLWDAVRSRQARLSRHEEIRRAVQHQGGVHTAFSASWQSAAARIAATWRSPPARCTRDLPFGSPPRATHGGSLDGTGFRGCGQWP
jgi:hypothetical protein